MSNHIYKIAGHTFEFRGVNLTNCIECIIGLSSFKVETGENVDFLFCEGLKENIPITYTVQYDFEFEDVRGKFCCTKDGHKLILKPHDREALVMWCRKGENVVCFCGNWEIRLCRFAVWAGFGLMTLKYETLAIHGSCIVCNDKAVIFLGESGTGKSTHTRLWKEYVPGAKLLNDDSPIIRIEDNKVWAYGSAWSGKTACYINKRYKLAACVRLSQAPHNKIKRLSVVHAYGALHPSCAPVFAYDELLYDYISCTIGKILSIIPIYHLECLPNKDACILSYKTLFKDETYTE